MSYSQNLLTGSGKADSTFEGHPAGGLDVTAASSGNGANWNSNASTSVIDDPTKSYEGNKYINMAGGLLNLISTGSQNIILNGNPKKSFFKATYAKHTNFGLQKFRINYRRLL